MVVMVSTARLKSAIPYLQLVSWHSLSVRLVPANDDFDEIKLTNKGKDVRKYKVVGVRRSKVKVVG